MMVGSTRLTAVRLVRASVAGRPVAAGATSTAVHAVLIALAVGATAPSQRAATARPAPNVSVPLTVRLLAWEPRAPASPNRARHPSASAADRRRRAMQRMRPHNVAPKVRLVVRQPTVREPPDDPPAAELKLTRPANAPALDRDNPDVALGNRADLESRGDDGSAGDDGRGSSDRGYYRVVELATAPGTACPELKRPPDWHSHGRPFTVSVGFTVDTAGAVEPASLHVIESPVNVREPARYFSHIYVVGERVSSDEALRKFGAGWDSVVAASVVQHVATLAFKPAVRDGRPERATVLISCQAS